MTDWAAVELDNDERDDSPVDDIFASDSTALIGGAVTFSISSPLILASN